MHKKICGLLTKSLCIGLCISVLLSSFAANEPSDISDIKEQSLFISGISLSEKSDDEICVIDDKSVKVDFGFKIAEWLSFLFD